VVSHDDEDLRIAVYREFATTGRAPEGDELARMLGAPLVDVEAGLRRLADQRHVVLDHTGRIVMAHPFAAIPLGFVVMGSSTLWWGGCAWDSFAVPHVLTNEPEVLVATRCPGCGVALSWVVGREAPPLGSELAHFLVPAARVWEDVVYACANQRLFCGGDCIEDWLARTGNQRGAVFDLATLWRLAAHWYDGRLDRGYVRREPAEAAAYFADVGLYGRFWGTPQPDDPSSPGRQ
jgi:Alkylmercury lyase